MPAKLLIAVPGMYHPFQHDTHGWDEWKKELAQSTTYTDYEWRIWDPKVGVASTRRAENLAAELSSFINELWETQRYSEIVLIGHSMGGMLVRAAYLQAASLTYGKPDTELWSGHVGRIILFASVNKGVQPIHIPHRWLALPLLSVLHFYRRRLARDLFAGASFVTDLRIGWIRYFRQQQSDNRRLPVIIQLLGTHDGLITHEDSMDMEQFPNGGQIDVSGATHDNLYRYDWLPAADQKRRKDFLLKMMLEYIPTQALLPPKSPKVQKVIFILPGIRDLNPLWAQRLKEIFERKATHSQVIIGAYGYFSALQFLWPQTRKRNIRWFKDAYSTALAQAPDADFYFVGHSNGTYILGESLRKLRHMRFKRVYLAGSVLPTDYDWPGCSQQSQVAELRNDKSAWDYPVAILCNAMQALGMKDVGLGGFDGFQNRIAGKHEEVAYYAGGHGAPVEPENLANIADYILQGQGGPSVPLPGLVSSNFQRLSNAAPIIAILLAVALVLSLLAASYAFFINGAVWPISIWALSMFMIYLLLRTF